MKVFPCAFAVEATMKRQLCCLSHTQKTPKVQVSWDGATALELPVLSLTHQFLERILHVPARAKSSCLDLAGARFSSRN